MARARASSPAVSRARKEKSSSRRAARRLEMMRRGRTTPPCTAKAKPSHRPSTRRSAVHCTFALYPPSQSRRAEPSAPGAPATRARSRMRFS
jgi:hypothetical protein